MKLSKQQKSDRRRSLAQAGNNLSRWADTLPELGEIAKRIWAIHEQLSKKEK